MLSYGYGFTLLIETRQFFPLSNRGRKIMAKPKSVKPGKVQKIIPPPFPGVPEKAEIAVEGADHLYREIRIENTLEDEKGHEVKLKLGANVDVVVEADKAETVPK
jgi:hypothetical protein